MKRTLPNCLRALTGVVCLALAAAGKAAPPAHEHAAQAPHDATHGLRLNAGKKWQTDQTLRQGMRNIREAMAGSVRPIHDNRLSAAAYGGLARKIEGEVATIVANCKLEPEADAQLHIVVADLLAGAEQMSGKGGKTKRRDGAVKVIAALANYATYFDDSGFEPIAY